VLINVTGGYDLTLFELDEAANRIREEVDEDANIIVGSTLDETMEGKMRVSVVATGIDVTAAEAAEPVRDVYGAAAMKGRAPMTETLEEVAAVAEARPSAAAPAAEPSLFESFSAEASPRTSWSRRDRRWRAGPGLSPAAAPSQPTPGRLVAMNHAPVAADDRVFVAPKAPPAGAPTPEALARLRDAIQRDAPRPAAPAPAAAPVQEAEQPARRGSGSTTSSTA
jgi:cell division protein FtsZ